MSLHGRRSRRGCSFTLSWGAHRLTVIDRENNTSSTTQFYVGWYGGSDSDEETPDTLRVASDKENYAPGETARVRIEAPFAGEAMLAIATDRIISTRNVEVPAGGTTIDMPVSADWGPGAYALVTAWRPLDKPADRTPTRAIGLAWLGLDPKLRTLAVQIGTPEKITPRQRIEVPIKVGNLGGEEAFVTLAAVDEGILQLTRFKTPDPADYYFGKRRLGVAMRDDYGRLLETRADDLGRIRVGGDAGDIGGLDIVPTRTVALFSGPVKLDAQGEAKIAIEVPDFIGQLRLMAVAYAKSRVGSADQRLYVRDAVSADVVLPRFLAPNDRGRLALSLHNIDGQAGDYRLTVQATGAVSLDRPVAETRRLAAGQRELLTWPLVAGNEAGFGKVAVEVSGPGNFAVRREWDIQVRAAQTPSAVDTVSQLGRRPRAHARPQRHGELRARHRAGRRVADAHSRHRRRGPAAGARQVSVRLHRADDQPRPAVALLQRRGAAGLRAGRSAHRRSRAGGGLPHRRHAAARRLVRHVGPLLARRRMAAELCPRLPAARPRPADGGAVGLAAARPDLAQPHGRTSSRPTPRPMPGTCWPRPASPIPAASATSRTRTPARSATAWPGRSSPPRSTTWPSPAGRGWPSPRRARRSNDYDRRDYYGSPLRNRAALLALAAEAGGREGFTQVAALVGERLTANADYTTTQEQAWLVMAAHAMAGRRRARLLARRRAEDGDARSGGDQPRPRRHRSAACALKNEGDSPVWMQVTARGVPNEPLPAASQGLSVQREFLTLDGRPRRPAARCARTSG